MEMVQLYLRHQRRERYYSKEKPNYSYNITMKSNVSQKKVKRPQEMVKRYLELDYRRKNPVWA